MKNSLRSIFNLHDRNDARLFKVFIEDMKETSLSESNYVKLLMCAGRIFFKEDGKLLTCKTIADGVKSLRRGMSWHWSEEETGPEITFMTNLRDSNKKQEVIQKNEI